MVNLFILDFVHMNPTFHMISDPSKLNLPTQVPSSTLDAFDAEEVYHFRYRWNHSPGSQIQSHRKSRVKHMRVVENGHFQVEKKGDMRSWEVWKLGVFTVIFIDLIRSPYWWKSCEISTEDLSRYTLQYPNHPNLSFWKKNMTLQPQNMENSSIQPSNFDGIHVCHFVFVA